MSWWDRAILLASYSILRNVPSIETAASLLAMGTESMLPPQMSIYLPDWIDEN